MIFFSFQMLVVVKGVNNGGKTLFLFIKKKENEKKNRN